MPSSQSNQPSVPTMTNASLIPQLETAPPRNPRVIEELGEDIVALPLGAPDFANDVKPYLVNPGLHPRWIFTDRRRFAQAVAQGWRVCKQTDLKPGYAKLTPFAEEGGTKYINGDLILMLINRQVYLGALKYKHQVAAALSDSAVQRTLSAQSAAASMPDVAAVNQRRAAQGNDPVMTVFTPGAADLRDTVLGGPKGAAEVSRLGNAKRDTGPMADLAKNLQTAKPADSTST